VGLDKNGKDNIESQVLMVAESNFSISAGIHGLMIILDSADASQCVPPSRE